MTDTWTAASWNVFNGTGEDRLREGLGRIIDEHGASVIALQEAQNVDPALLAEFSYECVRFGDCLVAWHNVLWTPLSAQPVQLSESAYFRPGKSRAIRPRAPFVILAEPLGRTVTVGSIHTPSAVQRGGEPNDKLPRRVTVLSEAMATLGTITRAAKTHAVLVSGDDNADEAQSPSAWERITGKAVTGLNRAVPPGPTMGQRSIDEFRYRRLTVERVWSIPGYGEEKPRHAIIFGEFGWRR